MIKFRYIDYLDKEREISLEQLIINSTSTRSGKIEELEKQILYLTVLNIELLNILHRENIITNSILVEMFSEDLEERNDKHIIEIIVE